MKHCDQCGKSLTIGISTMSPRAVRCSLINDKGLSECQKAENRRTAQVARDTQSEQGKTTMYKERKRTKPKLNSNEAMRICLRCGDRFLSNSVHNRICEVCSNINEGLNVPNLSRINAKAEYCSEYHDIINDTCLEYNAYEVS